jgi:hypothetical protein
MNHYGFYIGKKLDENYFVKEGLNIFYLNYFAYLFFFNFIKLDLFLNKLNELEIFVK